MGSGANLAFYAAALEWRDLPEEVCSKALDHVLDTIGTMFTGISVDACKTTRKVVETWGHGNDATVAGIKGMYPMPSAAFLNALHCRIHTYDDTYEPGTLHPGGSVVSAAMALAEKYAVDGKSFVVSVIAGYEVATRVAAAVSPSHYAKGFHNTGTCNVFGATAAAARVLQLNGSQMNEAFGLAGATAAGLRQHQIDGSMLDSAFHGARAAQSGVMVAQMRAAGVKGPTNILDGSMGFCVVMAPEYNLNRLDEQLGNKFEFMETTIKLYPNCRFVHGPIEIALELQSRHKIDFLHIEKIEIATFEQSIEVSDRADIRTLYDATASLQYGVALALIKKKVDLASFSEEVFQDSAIRKLMKNITVINDQEYSKLFPRVWPQRVTIILKDGREFSLVSDYPPGRLTPVSQRSIDDKFLANSSPYLGPENANEVLSLIRNLPDCQDIRKLTRALKPSVS